MYLPNAFKNTDVAQLHSFIENYNFATLISKTVSHLPLMLKSHENLLVGHMAKANPQWQEFEENQSVLCIFHGPHAYISPAWYKNQPSVPTWNYAVVHVTGTPEIITDKTELLNEINLMIKYFDPKLPELNTEYTHKLADHIVGFKIKITEIIGKFKLGQNRSKEDQTNMLSELENSTSFEAQQLAKFIRSTL